MRKEIKVYLQWHVNEMPFSREASLVIFYDENLILESTNNSCSLS